jgi:MoaA/NifB/PqqE/SkfB family radical SAM enzyme
MYNIEDKSNRYQIIWDLGRRCSYACTYCPPHRNNKTSPFIDFETLRKTMSSVAEYAFLYDNFRKKPAKKKLSFTGGEPTVHPDFFKLLKYIKNEFPDFSRGLTTNGWFGNNILDKVLAYTTGGTISYHCESTKKQKNQVISNAIVLREKYKCNVMFHKDYFWECVDVCEKLEKNGVDFVPRIIGDDNPTDKKSIKYGYTHVYGRKEMKWFRNYWKQKGQNVTEEGDTQKGLGRPCCGGRCFKADGVDSYFLADTNFLGWNCMVNWYFLFLNSEANRVWTHQTCGVNLDGEVAPLGKITEFENIIDELEHELYVHNRIPMITCPKTFCGCGMCVTKTSQNIEPMFTKHVVPGLDHFIVPQKESNYEIDITTKKVLNELDSSNV